LFHFFLSADAEDGYAASETENKPVEVGTEIGMRIRIRIRR